MPARPIVMMPNQIFRQKAEHVSTITNEITQLAQDMAGTVLQNDGCAGIASQHIGALKKIIICAMDENGEKSKTPLIMINTEILWQSDETSKETEGSVSLPNISAQVERPIEIEVKYLDMEGNEQSLRTKNWRARTILHERDHHDGIIFLDHLSKLRRQPIKKALNTQGIKLADI